MDEFQWLGNKSVNDIHFDKYNLETNDLFRFSILVTTIISSYIIMAVYLTNVSSKSLSKAIVILNSIISSAFSIVYLFHHLSDINKLLYKDKDSEVTIYDVLHSVDDWSYLLCLWQVHVHIYNLIFGYIFYKSLLSFPIIGYHIASIFWLGIIMVGSGVILNMNPSTAVIAYLSIEEIPMIVFYFGYMISSVKYDGIFGALYLVFRVIYHAFLLFHAAHARCHSFLLIVMTIIFIKNLNIFNIWFTRNVQQVLDNFTRPSDKNKRK